MDTALRLSVETTSGVECNIYVAGYSYLLGTWLKFLQLNYGLHSYSWSLQFKVHYTT